METLGTDERAPVGALVRELLEAPQGFNLFQAVSLLERASPALAPVGTGHGQIEAVRLSALVSLSFQASDLARVRPGNKDDFHGYPVVLTTPVMSLAGANGPLPMPMTEAVMARSAARQPQSADFLDIFNHRFLAFLYRNRKKHSMGLNWQSPQSSTLAACLDALSALGLKVGERAQARETVHPVPWLRHVGPPGQPDWSVPGLLRLKAGAPRQQPPVAWLRHAGLQGGAPRSMTGLLALLSDRLGLAAGGAQFCGGWRQLEARDAGRLSSRASSRGACLGRTAVLGGRVWDQSAGIRIEFRNLPLQRLRSLLRGGAEHELLNWLVRRYLQQDLSVEVALSVDVRKHRPATLNRVGQLRLGWTSWLATTGPGRNSLAPARLKLRESESMHNRAHPGPHGN